MPNIFTSFSLFALSSLALSLQTVYAQDLNKQSLNNEQPTATITLDQITIIGSKQDAALIAGSGYYVDEDQLNNEHITDINQVLKTVPGVYISEEDGLGLRPNISIRAGIGGRSSKVHLMEDGVPIAPAPYAAPAAYYHPTASRMSGVEVLKGAPLLRYGPQTTGGVINYVSTPIPTDNEGKVTATVNDRGGIDLHAYAGMQEGDFAGLIETVQTRGKGYKKINGNDIGDYDNQDYVLKGRYQVNPDHSLSAKIQHSIKSSDETYLGLTDEDFNKDPNHRYPMSGLDKMDNKHTGINLTHNWQIDDNSSIHTTAYHNKTHRNWYKLSGNVIKKFYKNQITQAQLDGTEDLADITVKANDRTYKSTGVQTNYSTDIVAGGVHSIEIGARYHQDKVTRYQPSDIFNQVDGQLIYQKTKAPNASNNREEKADAVSLWLTDSWQISDPLTLNAALRYELIDTEETRGVGTNSEKKVKNKQSVFLPGLSGTYHINDNLQLLAGVHKGFSPLGAGVSDDDDKDPEESINYELGTRYTSGDSHFEAVAFYSDFDSVLKNCSENSPCGTRTSGTEKESSSAVISGIEMMAGTRFYRDGYTIPLSATYTYTEAKLAEDYQDTRDGDRLTLVPKNQASVRTGIEMDSGWDTYLTAKYIDGICESVGCNRTNNARSKTDPLLTFDVISHYPIGYGAKVFGKVENITDKQAIVSRTPYGARPNMPRTFTVGITKEF
ncbi:TonB-dependent receptor family protein [Psychrobacter phenylpyruvicus]|uniref:Iron(III) dicitrate transport protein FecA n=1 Tax=Psychrobacter phenylpyruvicus TaxID=29432 RepID=A0A379LNM3_9GAMM|nr:TonB-dependent receptor [Psychrobacter phenylpyruvicus]SUD91364.1 Iron(III) dicitrate transport protein FecA [Psychrobacter phenylpyruvicus]